MYGNDVKDIFEKPEGENIYAVLVGIDDGSGDTESLLDELERLLETSGGVVYARLVQPREKPDPRTYIGSGKVGELKELCAAGEVSLVVFDSELSPAQIKNLEDDLGGDVTVIDRSMLILLLCEGRGRLSLKPTSAEYAGAFHLFRHSFPNLKMSGISAGDSGKDPVFLLLQ